MACRSRSGPDWACSLWREWLIVGVQASFGGMNRLVHHFVLRQFALRVSAFGPIYFELRAAVRALHGPAVLAPASPAAGRGGFVLLPVYLFSGRESLPAETASAVVGRLYLPETLPLEPPSLTIRAPVPTITMADLEQSIVGYRLPEAGRMLVICGRSGWILSGPPSPCCMPWGCCRRLQP